VFPDQQVRLDNMIAEGDFVAIRAAYLGTQTGPMDNLPATGKSVDGPFIAFFRIDSGKIAELWVEWDNVAMLTQLGLLPPMLPEDADAKRKKLAVDFLRGIYTGDPSVVDQIGAPDIVVSYPIFDEIFKTPAIRGRDAVRDFAIGFSKRWIDARVTVRQVLADGDAVVLIWEFQARSANPDHSGDAELSKKAWGGITLYRFNDSNQIILELGEESTPGPAARVPAAFNEM
jgi:predicted ester cyclase